MLSRKAKYALRALEVLAGSRGERWTAHALAGAADVPGKFLETILVELRDAGLIESTRGASGGHRLARAPSRIHVGEVIRIIDGPLAPLRCASVSAYEPCADCPDPARCSLRALMGDVRQAMADVLDQRSLSQLINRKVARIPAEETSRAH